MNGWGPVSLTHAGVVPNDTFSVNVIGYYQNDTSAAINLVDPASMATFGASETGATQTFASTQAGGSPLEIHTAEFASQSSTRDNIYCYFGLLTARSVDQDGNPIDHVQISIGNFLGGTTPLTFTESLAGASITDDVNVVFDGMYVVDGAEETPVSSLTNGDLDLSLTQTLSTTLPSYEYGFETLFAVTVPEPSTVATTLLGLGGLLWFALKRRRAGLQRAI